MSKAKAGSEATTKRTIKAWAVVDKDGNLGGTPFEYEIYKHREDAMLDPGESVQPVTITIDMEAKP